MKWGRAAGKLGEKFILLTYFEFRGMRNAFFRIIDRDNPVKFGLN